MYNISISGYNRIGIGKVRYEKIFLVVDAGVVATLVFKGFRVGADC